MRLLAILVGVFYVYACGIVLVACAGCRREESHATNPIDKAIEKVIGGTVLIKGNTAYVPPLSPEVAQLVAAGRQDVPYMLEKMQSPDLRIRTYVAYAMGEIGDARSAEPLIGLVEEMRTSRHGPEEWRRGVGYESMKALSKIKSPLISAYALRKVLSMNARDLVVEGAWYAHILKAQGVEADIKLAIDSLRVRRQKNGPNANVDAMIRILTEGGY